MKKIIYKLSFLLGVAAFITACEEKDRTFPEYANIEHGAYPSQVGSFTGPNGKDFNFNDPDNASVTFTVEFYDDENGQTVDSYSWTANHAPSGTSAQIASMDRSQFVINPDNGRPRATFTFTMSQALDVLGLTIDSVSGGQAIDFYATLTTNRGQVFTRANTNDVTEGAPSFKALFQFKSNLICPSALEGTFDAHTVAQGTWCSSTWDGVVIWENKGNGVYDVLSVFDSENTFHDMSMGAYYVCYGSNSEPQLPNGSGAGSLRITDACYKLAFAGASQWGEIYEFNSVTVNGTQLTLDWVNSYGEAAITTLTRQDGQDWPALYK